MVILICSWVGAFSKKNCGSAAFCKVVILFRYKKTILLCWKVVVLFCYQKVILLCSKVVVVMFHYKT